MRSIPMPLLAALWLLAAPAMAQQPAPTGRISGRVIHGAEGGVPDAVVRVMELGRSATVGSDGSFAFDAIPDGTYLLTAESRRHGIATASVEVAGGNAATVEMDVDLSRHQETVVVTAAGVRTLADVAQPMSVLSGADLARERESTLGETLSRQPGVSSTSFGPGSSRPVIRGFSGDRIRILQDGVGSGDASNTSPDHAVSSDPLSARQIEVVRGPATLLYGSNAIGGVVNVLDGRVPETPVTRVIGGMAEGSFGTAANEKSGGVTLDGGRGRFAWHVDGFARDASDVSIPGFAESDAIRAEEEGEGAEHEQSDGVLANSATEGRGGAVGASLAGERGFIGLALSGYDTLYGVPGHAEHGEHDEAHGGEEPEEEAAVRIDLQQLRLDVRGELRNPFSGVSALRLRFGATDYEHVELEGEEIGTTFTNDAWEGRLEAQHRKLGAFEGTVGFQTFERQFEAIGAEAFLPPTETRTWALFAFEEAGRGALRFQLGARLESQTVEATTLRSSRGFKAFSGSAGVMYKRNESWRFSASLAHSSKLPTAEELYSNGPHIATRVFEIGDTELGKETSLGLDLGARFSSERVKGEISGFVNRFSDYIYESFTGEEEDGLQVAQYIQGDARFVGLEGSVSVDLLHDEPHHLDVEVSGDLVRAQLSDGGTPLPRITPARFAAGLHFHSEHWNARAEVRHVFQQDRVAAFERPTDGYAMLNASLGYRVFAGTTIVDFILRGRNLLDAEARNHVSFLKDLAPLPGRDVRLVAQVRF